MLDLILSVMVRGFNLLFGITPMSFNLWLGRRCGFVVYLFNGKRRRVAYANLKAAFADEKTPKELRRITKKIYINMLQSVVELLSMAKFGRKYAEKYFSMRDMDKLQLKRLSESGKGVIFVTGHFGNWELSAVTSAVIGFPLHFLGREQKMKRVDELINLIRESKGNSVIRKGTDVKRIIRVLRKGEIVGMALDQNAGVNGELVDMFGRSASMAIGPFRLAERTGAYILPTFMCRLKGQYHEFVLEPEMTIKKGTEDVKSYMREFNRLLEKHIRAYPDQWLWMHKRWKMTPLKKIMVLDDGRKGHLKQSLAVVKQIGKFREAEGYAPGDLDVKWIKVKFKSKARRAVLDVLSFAVGRLLQGRSFLLKWALEEESYNNIESYYADVIISCGSALFGVNFLMKAENNARNLTVLDPGGGRRKRFDLVVIPRHDATDKDTRDDKVIVTDLAPNLIDAEEMKKKDMKKRVGLLFGGDNSQFTFSDTLTRGVADAVKAACGGSEAVLRATTSRRTSENADALLKEELGGCEICESFVSGRTDTAEDTVEKILASSDVVIVSGESISMVSEAVSSGKPVLVFMPDKKVPGLTKYERFVDDLEERKYLKRVKVEDIPERSREVLEKRTPFAIPDDDRRIYEKLYRLF